MHRAEFELVPWRKDLVVLHGGSQQQLADIIRADLSALYVPNEHTRGHVFLYEGKPYVLWVAHLEDVLSVVHEAQHVTFAVLRSRGIRPGAATEEAFAYTLEHIVGLVLDHRDWTVV